MWTKVNRLLVRGDLKESASWLVEAGGQIACQHVRPLGQTLGARWIGSARGLCLLHEVPDLVHLRLLIFV